MESVDALHLTSPASAPTLEHAVRSSRSSRSSRTSRRRPGRREELLAASLDVIRRVGSSASMDEMAAEAGITKPVLYRYFGDRDGLIGAVADRFASDLVQRLEAALAGPAGAGDAERPAAGDATRAGDATVSISIVRAAIDCYVGFIEEDPALYGFLAQHAAPASAALVAVVDRVAAAVTAAIRANFASLGIDPAPAETWAYGIVGMVHLAGAAWARDRRISREALVEDLSDLVAYGLTGAAASLTPLQHG